MPIAAGAAVDRVGAVAGLAHDVRVGLAEHGVVVPSGLEQVGAGSAAQHVVAAAADQPVVAQAAGDDVVAGGADEHVGVLGRAGHDVGARVGTLSEHAR